MKIIPSEDASRASSQNAICAKKCARKWKDFPAQLCVINQFLPCFRESVEMACFVTCQLVRLV
jgi:hypothetical protein